MTDEATLLDGAWLVLVSAWKEFLPENPMHIAHVTVHPITRVPLWKKGRA